MSGTLYYRYELIRCPNCGKVQSAAVKIDLTQPFDEYVHDCIFCGYTIMESEWDTVNAKSRKRSENT